MIYCPQCGSGMSETTKFCKNCGLPLAQLRTYVSSGGTSPLSPTPPQSHTPGLMDGLTPKQQLILTILLFVFAPGILGTLGGVLGLGFIFKPLVAISSTLMPLGIIWAVFRYKTIKKRMRQQTWYPQAVPPPPQPLAQGNIYQPPLPPQQTNPLPHVRPSVVEDETQRFPGNRR
ncbi:MAG TPA: zinc ribbon domain-containing protein [Blastocatellia bacterium]|nr:zinc ribbon domain-containing protein [Blastocatellia bacterium]